MVKEKSKKISINIKIYNDGKGKTHPILNNLENDKNIEFSLKNKLLFCKKKYKKHIESLLNHKLINYIEKKESVERVLMLKVEEEFLKDMTCCDVIFDDIQTFVAHRHLLHDAHKDTYIYKSKINKPIYFNINQYIENQYVPDKIYIKEKKKKKVKEKIFICGIMDCAKRYKTKNGYKYHLKNKHSFLFNNKL